MILGLSFLPIIHYTFTRLIHYNQNSIIIFIMVFWLIIAILFTSHVTWAANKSLKFKDFITNIFVFDIPFYDKKHVYAFIFCIIVMVTIIAQFLAHTSTIQTPNNIWFITLYQILMAYLSVQANNYTDYGKDIIGKIIGLNNFIKHGSKAEMEEIFIENENLYYEILPYAIAMGLANSWAMKFKDLNVKSAEWYTSDYVLGYNENNLLLHINSSLFNANKAILLSDNQTGSSRGSSTDHNRSSSGSSSGSSGGSSGGGFGGSSGGSW